jgi:hypothetical protein
VTVRALAADPSAAGHPFRHTYIGLGLRDDASIVRDGDTWQADYTDDGEPYLRIRIGPGARAEVVAFDAEGGVAARTIGPSLGAAIGQHATWYALAGEAEERLDGAVVTRFWRTVAFRTPGVWVDLAPRDEVYAFVPAIGIGMLTVPVPPGERLRIPEPGPVARRIGLDPYAEPFGPVRGELRRWFVGLDEPETEPVRLYRWSVPGILVGELVEGIRAANGPLRAIEWRPFLITDQRTMANEATCVWTIPPGTREHRFGLRAFGVGGPAFYLPRRMVPGRPA